MTKKPPPLPIVLELAPLPREQVGPFLLLGVDKTAAKEEIEANWAQRVIWARKGQVKTPRTVCYDILREIMRESRQFNPREFRILASQEVIDLFLEEESQHMAMLGDFIGKPISLQVESTFHQEQYDIILM